MRFTARAMALDRIVNGSSIDSVGDVSLKKSRRSMPRIERSGGTDVIQVFLLGRLHNSEIFALTARAQQYFQ